MPTSAPVPAPQASIARGLSVIAALALLVIVGRTAWQLWPAATAASRPICAQPVEFDDGNGGRLLCADDVALEACGELVPGDRLVVDDNGCRIDPAGMRAAWRLLRGLPLDVNRVSAEELRLLDGIGPAIAAAIVEERQAGGAFDSVEGLERVSGIGPATVERLRPFLTVLGSE